MQNAQKMKEHCKMNQIYALLREYMHCRARAGGTWKTGGSGRLLPVFLIIYALCIWRASAF